MLKIALSAGTALIALCSTITPARAQISAPAEAPGSEEAAPAEDIVVTGTTRAQRRFDVSYAINTITPEDAEKIAPVNFADLIGQLPGFQTEITGGEVQNIYRIRGLPNDGGFVSFQQDGLPVFHENDGIFFRGDAIIKSDLMTDRIEVVRGGPAPVYASYSGAIINAISVTGSDKARGRAQLTLGDTGLFRLDAYQAGPLGKNTYYAVGGFLRYHDGYRDSGFPSDKGGQVRANIKHDLDNGSVLINFNYVNDHNVFYLPIPIANPFNPDVSLDPYIDYFDGTMNSPAFRNVNLKYRDGAGVIQNRKADLSDGRHVQAINFGAQYEGDFGGWLVSAKAGYTQGKLDFAAFYSTTNPENPTTFANGYLARSRTAFGAVTSLRYVLAGTNTAYDPAAASGLIMQGQFRSIKSDFYSAQANLSVARRFNTGIGSHDIKLGIYASAYGESRDALYQNYLIEVAGQPRPLDLVAYGATGTELGRVTDNGVLGYATTLNPGDGDAKMFALFANDTWEIMPGLRIDGGARYERYDYKGWAALTAQVNLGDPKTLADDTTRALTGVIDNSTYSTSVVNWTIGANYDFSDHIGVYGRASHLETPPNVQTVMTANPTIITTIADQFEAGIKLAEGRSYLYITGFYTNFDPLNASFLAYNPITGRNDQNVPFIGKARVKGVEFDGSLRVVPWFSLNGALTISDPKYQSFRSTTGADPLQAEGNQIVRQPKIYGNIRPSFDFKAGKARISIYGRYTYMGKRYVDLYNNTALPEYGTTGAGVSARRDGWRGQIIVDNLFNAHGLTEGNSRTDNLSGQGSAEAIYGRPIFGRNFRLVISKSW